MTIAGVENPLGHNTNMQNVTQDENVRRGDPYAGILTYVIDRVRHGRTIRDTDYAFRWDEYTRIWRGFWSSADKSRDSERSKLISPALQQSIEMTVAEMEEATFGKEAWVDLDDDRQDEQPQDAIAMRDQLLEDFKLERVPDAISSAFLLGAIYGTGIWKINVREVTDRSPVRDERSGALKVQESARVAVTVDALRPDEFVPDPAALTYMDAQWCAHEILLPLGDIEQKQASGVYRRGHVGPYQGNSHGLGKPDGIRTKRNLIRDSVRLTEFFGRVPANLIPGAKAEADGKVEAIVTIANETFVLRAVESPYTMKDRPIVAYQHDRVPGQFWGRGVAEKGYNPQKALDAELRARVDALALTTAPMMGADITRMPRNPDMRVRPGKVWLTRGRPSDILEPIAFPPINPATFQQTGDLERMVQMGTGAMDSATPIGINRRNETASGMSQLNAGFIKRSKRTMRNVEPAIADLVKKSLWRYMQFAPEKYPTDFKFIVNSTMGIMAKEVEQQQLTQMLGFVPPDSPAFNHLLKAIFENSSSANKADLMAALEAMAPNPEQVQLQQKVQQLNIAAQEAEIAKTQAEAAKEAAEADLAKAKAERERVLADLEDDKVQIQATNAVVAAERTKVAREQVVTNQRKIEVDSRKQNKPKEGGK